MPRAFENVVYLIAAVCFILAFKGLAHPRTAVRGNRIGAMGMLLAVAVTLFDRNIVSFEAILAGLVLGAAVGSLMALKVQMTSMPQMVGLLNGFGGGASVLVAGAALVEGNVIEVSAGQMSVATAFSGLVGTVTFFGSLIAFSKLQEYKWAGVLSFKGQQALNALLLLVCIGLGAAVVSDPGQLAFYGALVAVAAVLGVLVVMPIGGADMPVVICLLNSYSGLAAAATGFVLNNNGLIIAGSLVGASGLILTQTMCKAMNRSMTNVLFGKMAAGGEVQNADDVYAGKVKSASPEEVAMILDGCRRVVVVPGYGLAVSQSQHALRDFANLLEQRGVEVEYGIHPVAGRMPGHMNVLLAEVSIPYEQVKSLDEINPTFAQTDVALVIGANDVVNPMARDEPDCPIAGMPILDVDKAKTVVVIKRSLSPGFAGMPNPLFAADNTLMLFGDGKKALLELTAAVKES